MKYEEVLLSLVILLRSDWIFLAAIDSHVFKVICTLKVLPVWVYRFSFDIETESVIMRLKKLFVFFVLLSSLK